MKDAYRRLDASLAQPGSGDAAFAGGPRELRAWLEALPLANATVAAARMRDGLQALSGKPLDGMRRLQALERVSATADGLAQGLVRQIAGSSFPLPAQKAEPGEFALALHGELAAGFRAALAGICAPAGQVPFLRGAQVALAAMRALQHGAAHLATAYLLYRVPPAGAWEALHAVHAFVAGLRLDDRIVDGSSARFEYVQALLLALANPYGCTQREQGELAAWIRVLAPHCRLRAGSGQVHEIAIPDADRGPGYLPDEQFGGRRDTPVLQMQPMLAFIEEQMALALPGTRTVSFRQGGGTALQVDAGLAWRSLAGWNGHSRERVRVAGESTLDTVLGLHDLHFVLAGEEFDGFMRGIQGEAISLSDADRAAPWRHRGRAAHAERIPAQVLDRSADGCRIVWERGIGGNDARARVGELVGMAEHAAGEPAEWAIGVIRWLRIDDEGRVDAGIERLAKRAWAVGVRVPEHARTMRGLLLSTQGSAAVAARDALLVPTEVDRATQELDLFAPDRSNGTPGTAPPLRIECLRLLEAGSIHHHFAWTPAVGARTDNAGIPVAAT